MSKEIKFKNDNLLQFRKEKGFSQEELGNIIGVSRQAIYKWESGERVPDINNLNALCKTFDKSLEDFIDGAEDLIKIAENKDFKTQKKFNIAKFIKLIAVTVIVIYLIVTIFKAIFINIMFLKVNKYKDHKNYSYSKKSSYYDTIWGTNEERIVSTDVLFANNAQRVIERSYNPSVSREIYYFIDPDNPDNNESFEYYSTVNDNFEVDTNWGYCAGDTNYELSPYNLVMVNIKDFYNLSFILNPLKSLKIDLEDKNLIIEKNNNKNFKKEIIYFDLETGFLKKIEEFEYEKIIIRELYFKYWFNWVDDRSVELTEEDKNEIKNNAGIE